MPPRRRASEFGKTIQKESDANLDLTYPIEAGLASPLTLSGGAEYRKEEYTSTAGDVQSYGSGPYAAPHPLYVEPRRRASLRRPAPSRPSEISGSERLRWYAARPTRVSSSQSSHGDLRWPGRRLSSSSSAWVWPPATRVMTALALATVGKFNTIWHTSDTVALRFTVGTGFHAPSPGQNNVQVLTTSFSQGVSLQQGTFPVTSVVAQYYGAIPLKPEKSTNYGVGIVLTPSSAFTTTIDYYEIKVRDRIFISKSYPVTLADIARSAGTRVGRRRRHGPILYELPGHQDERCRPGRHLSRECRRQQVQRVTCLQLQQERGHEV